MNYSHREVPGGAWLVADGADVMWMPGASALEAAETVAAYQAAADAPKVPLPDMTPSCPSEVTNVQARLALIGSELMPAVDAWVATQDAVTRARWEYGTTIARSDPLLAGAAAALGMTSEQVDDLFRLAATL